MKIQIIGYSGSGKSTLAKILAEHYKLPLLYLDATKFYADFAERSAAEQEAIVYDFLKKHDSWVIDGNYYEIAPIRYLEADRIFFLDFNRFVCLFAALKRYFRNRNRYRESLGCRENFDLSFFFWLIYGGRIKHWRKEHLRHLKSAPYQYHFKSRRELTAYLRQAGISTSVKNKSR